MGILLKINWVDILIVAVFVRAIYIGIERGFVIELFKFLGTLFALYIALHYCSALALFLHQKLNMPRNFEMVTYGFLWAAITLVAMLVRDSLLVLIHIEPQGTLNKWGSGCLAFFRGILTASLILLFFEISQLPSLQSYVSKSLMGPSLVRVAPSLYESCYDNVLSRLFPGEEVNKAVLKAKATTDPGK